MHKSTNRVTWWPSADLLMQQILIKIQQMFRKGGMCRNVINLKSKTLLCTKTLCASKTRCTKHRILHSKIGKEINYVNYVLKLWWRTENQAKTRHDTLEMHKSTNHRVDDLKQIWSKFVPCLIIYQILKRINQTLQNEGMCRNIINFKSKALYCIESLWIKDQLKQSIESCIQNQAKKYVM